MAPAAVLFVALVVPMVACAQDSTSAILRTTDLKASFAASYTTSRNGQPTDIQQYALNASFFLQDVRQRGPRAHQHQLLADLGYLGLIDSTWTKGTDRFLLTLLWTRTAKRWTHAYSAMAYTQFLASEALAYDASEERMRTVRYGGVFVPGGAELGYGLTWRPWEGSSIQFNCATARLVCTPERLVPDTMRRHLARTANAVVDLQYGGAVVVSIDHPLNAHVGWTNASRLFCSGLGHDRVTFEVINRFAITLCKYLQLRVDTRLGRDPLLSDDLRFSQEVLLGLFLERQRKRP